VDGDNRTAHEGSGAHQGDARQAAASRITGDRHWRARGTFAEGAVDGEAIVDRRREWMLRRETVIGQQHAHARDPGQRRRELRIERRQVDAPRTAVQVEHRAIARGEFRRAEPLRLHPGNRHRLDRAIGRLATEARVALRRVPPHFGDVEPGPPHRLDRQPEQGVDQSGAEARHVLARGKSKAVIVFRATASCIRHDT
jgi:hypothetical protein